MKLYDSCITEFKALIQKQKNVPAQLLPCTPQPSWPRSQKEHLIMLPDTALELGHSCTESFEFIVWTDSLALVNDGKITCYGSDIPELAQGLQTKVPFGKVVVIGADAISEEEAYQFFETIDLVRYQQRLEGYMLRGFFQKNREWSRISHKALASGFDFTVLGRELLHDYKEIAQVRSAEVFFFTEAALIHDIAPLAAKSASITRALTKIFDNVIMDCKNCSEKDLCDEIDGLKQLHNKRV